MLQNSFGHTSKRRCRCDARTVNNKEDCADWIIWWIILGRRMVFPSYFFIYRSWAELFTLTFCLWNLERGSLGNVLAIVFIGILSIIVAFLYKATFKKFEGVLPGILYGFFWWAILFLGIGSIAPVIKSALQLSKETIVTTICIFILYGVFISYSVAFEANNVNQGEGTEKTNYSNK